MPSLSSLYNKPLIQKASVSGLIETPAVKAYSVDTVLQASTLSSVLLNTGGSTGVVTILVNGVGVAGLTNLTATTTPQTTAPSTIFALQAGDLIKLSYVSGSAADLFYTINYDDLVVGAA